MFPKKLTPPEQNLVLQRDRNFFSTSTSIGKDAPEAIDGNGGFQVTFVSKQVFPGMTLGSYFESSRDLILKTGLYTGVEEIHDINVGSKGFKKFGCVLNYQGFQVSQTFYLADIEGCFLALTYSYRGEQIKSELENIVASIKFY